ncbi:MAG: phosphate acyltransferase [Saccharofermentanales bacterium]|jgi:phosphate butyryltransferase
MYRTFSELTNTLASKRQTSTVALIGSQSPNSLKAILKASREGIVKPILIGNQEKTEVLLKDIDAYDLPCEFINCDNDTDIALQATKCIREGRANLLMKGKIGTATMMKAMFNRECGIRTGSIVSSVNFGQLAFYHKIIAMTDGAVALDPDVDQKEKIIVNTIDAMRVMGWSQPKVAVLAAIEKVNPAMQATVDANELRLRHESGKICNCLLEGPMAIDVAFSKKAADEKGIKSMVAGDADLLIYPDLTAGNIGIKTLSSDPRNLIGGVIIGLQAPIAMSSRSASAENKYLSLILASAMT